MHESPNAFERKCNYLVCNVQNGRGKHSFGSGEAVELGKAYGDNIRAISDPQLIDGAL